MATRSGQVFLPSVPDAFRGHVRIDEAHPSRGTYALVSDGQRFVVLPATDALRAALGKTVTLVRDSQGRILLQRPPARDLGR
jgi:hypothetical protein